MLPKIRGKTIKKEKRAAFSLSIPNKIAAAIVEPLLEIPGRIARQGEGGEDEINHRGNDADAKRRFHVPLRRRRSSSIWFETTWRVHRQSGDAL